MYSDNDFTPCPTCGGLGMEMLTLWGFKTFGHWVDSDRKGYKTFSDVCQK